MNAPGAARPGVCELAGPFARLAGRALLLLLAIAVVAEAGLRMLGLQPHDLQRIGFTATYDDGFTEWAMRPNVRINEYNVTNAFGLHEDREVTIAKPPGVKRVAVLGSSVVWAIGERLEDSIPRAMERGLAGGGCPAEVLNFGAHGYNILNVNAYVQSKVHRFQPDAVVVVMDLQMSFPVFPRVAAPPRTIRRAGWFEGLFKRASQYSVLLSWMDAPAEARFHIERWVPLPIASKPAPQPAAPATHADDVTTWFISWLPQYLDELVAPLRAKDDSPVVMKPATAAPPPPLRSVESYEQSRERELAGVIASLGAFARQMGFQLYVTTPYGPYFHASPEEFSKFSVSKAAQAADLYGGAQPAVRRETELVSATIARAARAQGAGVIDFQPRSRAATMADGYFSTDGIHFTPKGYRQVGSLVAERLLADGLCRTGR